jgi:hypothetical protein
VLLRLETSLSFPAALKSIQVFALGQKPTLEVILTALGSEAVGGDGEDVAMETTNQIRQPWNKA